MSELRIYNEQQPAEAAAIFGDQADIRRELAAIGIEFTQWEATQELDPQASQDEVIEAYRGSIDQLMKQYGFQSVDVISLHADHPDKDSLRDKFLHEHTHDDFEVRFFVDGEGLFNIHKDGKVFAVRCTRGDLISVPAGTRHWFDMGPQPSFKAIRLFTTPDGWKANFTGEKIADAYPRLEAPHYGNAA